ncbi:MAG: pilin [Betaproteobacteria bacterium]
MTGAGISHPGGNLAALTAPGDTIRMPWDGAGDDRVVRPALAVLFRMAVGPSADYYVPRFLQFEQRGRAFPSWHWPSFWLPCLWAFYRKLWLSGLLFAALPVAGAVAFAAIEPSLGESSLAWFAIAAALIWLLPAVVPAMMANGLLYRRIRAEVLRAEARGRGIAAVAARLTAPKPTTLGVALAAGLVAVVLAPKYAVPNLNALYDEHIVRMRLTESLAAVKPLQRQVEESFLRFGIVPRTPDYAAMLAHRGAILLDDVNLNPVSGRLRLALGSTGTVVDGKAILLVPAVDAQQNVRWTCVPVGIPRPYLPAECRNR